MAGGIAPVRDRSSLIHRRDKPEPPVATTRVTALCSGPYFLSEIIMCHHRKVGDWFKRVLKRLYERAQPVAWDAELAPQPVPVKAKVRKAKVKRVKKK